MSKPTETKEATPEEVAALYGNEHPELPKEKTEDTSLLDQVMTDWGFQ